MVKEPSRVFPVVLIRELVSSAQAVIPTHFIQLSVLIDQEGRKALA